MILSASYNQKSIEEIKNSFVVSKVKEIVRHYDENAEIILFGSHARGDWHEESDWNFLVLTKKQVNAELKKHIIYDANDIEIEEGIVLEFVIKNKIDWETKYLNAPIYYNIKDEGINV